MSSLFPPNRQIPTQAILARLPIDMKRAEELTTEAQEIAMAYASPDLIPRALLMEMAAMCSALQAEVTRLNNLVKP